MTTAVLWSGGKDCTYALHKARQQGVQVKYAVIGFFNDMLIPPTQQVILSQCESLDLIPIIIKCDLITFHTAIKQNLPSDINGLIYGETQSNYDIMWFKMFCKINNLTAHLPAHLISHEKSITEFFKLGYKAIITRMSTLDMHYAGKPYDLPLYLRNKDSFKEPFGSACSLQTFVYDGPLFQYPLNVELELKYQGRVKMIS